MVVPPPIFSGKGVNAHADQVNEVTVKLIPEIGAMLGLGKDRIIDGFSRLGGSDLTNPSYFCTGAYCD